MRGDALLCVTKKVNGCQKENKIDKIIIVILMRYSEGTTDIFNSS